MLKNKLGLTLLDLSDETPNPEETPEPTELLEEIPVEREKSVETEEKFEIESEVVEEALEDEQSEEVEETVEVKEDLVCNHCQEHIELDDEFCGNCGRKQEPQNEILETTNPELDQEVEDPEVISPELIAEMEYLQAYPVPVLVSCSALSDIGNVKDMQEDAFIVKEIRYPMHNIAVMALIVADGIGTPHGGELFAEIAVTKFWETLRFSLPYAEQQVGFDKYQFLLALNKKVKTMIFPAVQSANNRVREVQEAKKIKDGGCTIAIAVLVCDLDKGFINVHGYHEGDSPVFYITPTQLVELSDIASHEIGGALLCNLGRSSTACGKFFSKEIWMSETDAEDFAIGVCTDGLALMLSPEEMCDLFAQNNIADTFCEAAVNLSLTTELPFGKAKNEKLTTGDDNTTMAAAMVRLKLEN